MNKLRISLWIFLILVIATTTLAVTVFAPTKIEFSLVVDKDVNVTFNGRTYELIYAPTIRYQCIAKTGVNYTNPICYLPPKDVTLNKSFIMDITSAQKIIVDKSYYVQQGQKVYEIIYVQRNITGCLCEKPGSCRIAECYVQ